MRAPSHLRTAVLAGLSMFGLACGGLLEPTSNTLAGVWRAAPMLQQPDGVFLRTLELTPDGGYVTTGEFRGAYPQLPAGATASITRSYGHYVYADAHLR